MTGITRTLIFIFFLLNPLSGLPQKVQAWVSPVKPPYSFSGGFGELRRNHFHTGLDFRTSGQFGLPVFAAKDGSVARVSVSPYGYGHALYMLHSDGYTTVYGHLSRFHPKIEEYVIKQQYLLKQFAVDLEIPIGLIPFQKGETIAWSGNTGSSGGPHLHFEIRETASEKPQNPLFFLKNITDKSAPRITSLYLYPLSDNSQVNKGRNKLRVETVSANQTTKLKNQQPIEVFGDIGLGIQSDDDFNGIGLKCGIYSAKLLVDDEPAFSFKVDYLAFDFGRYVNSHIDYEELMKNKRWIHRLYLQPGNRNEIYRTNSNRGILRLTDGKIHTIKIVAADAFNNSNVLTFKLLSKKYQLPVRKANFTKLFLWDEINDFETEEVKIQLPQDALFDNLNFEYHSASKNNSSYSLVHTVHNQYVPLYKSYVLSIKVHGIPLKYQDKALVVSVDPSGKLSPAGGEYKDGWVTAHPRVFGNFTVVLDTVAPKILPISIKENKILANKNKIEFKISDNLSGIDAYEGEIDGNWVLFEFDAKTGNLAYTFDKKRIASGKMHTLSLKVTDERKNSSKYKAVFYW